MGEDNHFFHYLKAVFLGLLSLGVSHFKSRVPEYLPGYSCLCIAVTSWIPAMESEARVILLCLLAEVTSRTQSGQEVYLCKKSKKKG